MTKLPTGSRLILWCPYVHWYFGESVASRLFGQMGSSKYQWIREVIRENPSSVYLYCDSHLTSAVHYYGDILDSVPDLVKKKELSFMEALTWNEINDFKFTTDKFLFHPDHIQSGDIVFVFSSHFLDRRLNTLPGASDLLKVLSRKDLFKIVHLSHYVFNLENIAVNLAYLKFDMFCYESDLAKADFFKKHFPSISEVSIVPFAVQERFMDVDTSAERDGRCVVTGGLSFIKLDHATKEFFFHFSVNNFFPLRVLISENASTLSDYLTVMTGYYESEMKEAKDAHPFELSRWIEMVSVPGKILEIPRKKTTYYGKNILDAYRGHLTSYVSEEISHAPAIGFFESMACGAVPIGIDSFIYSDLGLIKDQNYLTFDGSLGDLIKTVTVVKNDPAAVAHMPAQNKEFVKRELSERAVATKFVNQLGEKYSAWCRNGAQR